MYRDTGFLTLDKHPTEVVALARRGLNIQLKTEHKQPTITQATDTFQKQPTEVVASARRGLNNQLKTEHKQPTITQATDTFQKQPTEAVASARRGLKNQMGHSPETTEPIAREVE